MENQELANQVDRAAARLGEVQRAVSEVIVGQDRLVESLLAALLCRGHVLLEGVPGLAKTLTVRTLAGVVGGSFQRLQFTPDLLPADVTGTQVFDPKTSEFVPHRGPVFANLVLADEINRAPAKVQSALLEAMEERQVTIGDSTHRLPEPFVVLATQNPIEQEGTYPLPEAQRDRFLLHVRVDYPDTGSEQRILQLVREQRRQGREQQPEINAKLSRDSILKARRAVLDLHLVVELERYLVQLVDATRHSAPYDPELEPLIAYGASPRGSIALDLAARAHAWLQGRDYVSPGDIHQLAPDVLRHRILLSYQAEADRVSTDEVIQRLLERVPVP